MAIREILIVPDPILRVVAAPVTEVDGEIRSLMDDMLETMYAAPGLGLAAPQIGVSKRVIVMDCSGDEEEPNPIRMANPEILELSDESATREEGCLSIPDFKDDVTRPIAAKVRYLDENNKTCEMSCEDLLAVCVQHEVDHLNGVLFIDHLSRLKRDMITRKLTKEARLNG
jgi:peptide deformylase